jgi:hypothetical protein
MTPVVPELRTPPEPVAVKSTVIALVIVTAPYPPGSSALISPPSAVLLMAPAVVLHGAVREHGLTSSPTPETQVRVACAPAGAAMAPVSRQAESSVSAARRSVMVLRESAVRVSGLRIRPPRAPRRLPRPPAGRPGR